MITEQEGTRKAVVLCSGGLDSTTTLYIAIQQGFDVYPVSFNYNQRHVVELEFVRQTLHSLQLLDRWKVFSLDFGEIRASALTDPGIDVPKGRDVDEMKVGIPLSYVPLRNTIFLAYSAAYAESIGAKDIFIGVNALDYSGYPDCRPEYIKSIQETLTLGSRYVDDPEGGLIIHAPLQYKTKAEIISIGRKLGVDYSKTWSCYDPLIENGILKPCGSCDSCILRKKGFDEAGGMD